MLNVQYRLCFTKLCEMEEIFDKNSFILETKLNVLKNFLLRVEREVQFENTHTSLEPACSGLLEEPSFQDK